MNNFTQTTDSSRVERTVARGMQVLAVGLGAGSLLAFGIFLFAGPLGLVDFGQSFGTDLAINTGLSLLFFVQHSWMVRRSFKQWLARVVPTHYLDASYAIASGLALLAVVLLWQDTAQIVWYAEGGMWWASRTVFVLGLVVGIWGGLSLKGFDSFGLRPIRKRFRTKPLRPPELVAQGAYRWVRHPLYLAVLLMIWSFPALTVDRLLFNMLWTIWIVVGAILEERDLVAEFGDDYREYQRNVPMLLPSKIPR